MSGHSKWSTIKRKKGAIDAARSKVFQKLAKELYVAAKSGDTDPNNNAALRMVIEKAKAEEQARQEEEEKAKANESQYLPFREPTNRFEIDKSDLEDMGLSAKDDFNYSRIVGISRIDGQDVYFLTDNNQEVSYEQLEEILGEEQMEALDEEISSLTAEELANLGADENFFWEGAEDIYATEEETLEEIYSMIRELIPVKEIHHTFAGCTVSTHCGPRTLGILFIEE